MAKPFLPHTHTSLGDALRNQAQLTPEHDALVFPESGKRHSFSQWLVEAERVALALVQLGVNPGDPVALLAENRLEWPIVQAAVALCGAVLVPLNTHFAKQDLRFALQHSRSKALFLSAQFRSHNYLETVLELRAELPHLEHLICFDEHGQNCIAYAELEGVQTQLPEVLESHAAGLLYTSGTTGFPKGALLSHRAQLFDSWQTSRRLAITGRDRWTSIIPLFHCSGCIMNIIGLLQHGACYVGVEAFSPIAMFEAIEREACTGLSGVPTSFLAMLEHPRRGDYDLGTLRAGTCGGADVSGDMLRSCAEGFPIPGLVNVYGQTETATIICCPSIDDEDRLDTVGPVLDGAELRITDPASGVALSRGQIGQVETRGPMVMDGYFDRPTDTQQTLSDDGWLKTGDLGFMTERGTLCLSGGRLRDMIIRGGENIYPVEIENWLQNHPAVQQVAVFAIADRYYGEAVAAAIISSAPVSAAELETHCLGHLAKFKIPSSWFQVSTFPLTASGKVRKVELQQAAAAHTLSPLS